MLKIYLGFAFAVFSLSMLANANEDMIAPLAEVEKVYSAPEPFGQMRISYSGPESNSGLALTIECELFSSNVPEVGLEDLPRPEWSNFHAAYSTASYNLGGESIDPYMYIQVPLLGPPGASWERTWAIFHFDQHGKLTRQIKQFTVDETTNFIRTLWEEWPIGSGVTAETILESAKNE